MKILNLYAGIGGNRKLWGDEHEITAVEYKPKIAKVYQDLFPNDNVITTDAHQYLLDHYEEFDFIWSSPPCPTHSKLGRLRALNTDNSATGQYSPPRFPDMKLYEEIIFLKHYFKGKWVVENVVAYYEPLIRPTEIQRHHFWSNFLIRVRNYGADNIEKGTRKQWESKLGYDLSKYSGFRKDTVLRNCVQPELGLHILNEAVNPIKLQRALL